jgi:diguanylate cyclase (GGDEF)-like protein
VEKAHFGSKRTLLCVLVLTAALLLGALGASRGPGVRPIVPVAVALWALFAWSLVASAHAVYTYMSCRSHVGEEAPETGLTDPLTGLPNRKGLLAALAEYETGIEKLGKRVRLIDVDLVNLNKVNYEFGQMVGDIVLQDIADVLRRSVPEEDLLCRLGGDEFLVVVPEATAEELEALAATIEKGITDYRLSLGERGEVSGVKATVSVADYVPDKASLHETVVSAKEATAHGRLAEEAGEEETFYHVPRVTLGAFAVHRWQALSKQDQDGFKAWQREPDEAFSDRMVSDIVRMLAEKAETHWVDFVTTAPSAAGRTTPAHHLAEAVAKHLGVAYRDVMRADTSGPETRSVEPAVDAVIDKGDGALLIADVVSSGILERRCVKKLAAAGAHLQVAAWAAY